MNPFTQSLLKQISDSKLASFVTYWDALEALVVRVYKSNAARHRTQPSTPACAARSCMTILPGKQR